MKNNPPQKIKVQSRHRILTLIFSLYGTAFLLMAFMNDQWLSALFEQKWSQAILHLTSFQLTCLFLSFVSFYLAYLQHHVRWIYRVLSTEWILNSCLALLAFTFPIISLEIMLRPYCNFVETETNIFQYDQSLGWKLKPSIQKGYTHVEVHTNFNGLRGPEISRDKSDYRVLFLGDSVMFGIYLDENETIPRDTRMLLKQNNDLKIESINAGVPGYCTWQEYLYYHFQGKNLHPDLVVLGFVLNDVFDNYRNLHIKDPNIYRFAPFSRFSIIDQIIRESSIIHLAMKWGHYYWYGKSLQEEAIYKENLQTESLVNQPENPVVQQSWDITLRLLSNLVQECRNNQSRVLLVAIPFAFQINDGVENPSPQKILQKFAYNEGIPFIDLLPAFKTIHQKTPSQKIFLDRCHLTVAGSNTTSQILANAIQSIIVAPHIAKTDFMD